MKITGTIIKALAPALSIERAQSIADGVNTSAPLYGIDTPLRLAAFLAQVAHESAGFTARNESLNYSEEGLLKTFSFYKKYPQVATEHGRTARHAANQQLIANTIYADKNRPADKKLGNVEPNDGWFFRGAGMMQLTGRAMITEYARYKKVDIKTVVEMLRSSDLWGIDSACWVFVVEKMLLDKADRDEIDAISKAINGSTAGLAERRKLYFQAKNLLGLSA